MVTLTGRGGVGKTRLAVEVIRVLGDGPGRRVIGVALAGVAGAEMVLGEIAAAIGLALVPNVGLADALADAIGDEELLLVLDNFEHVLARGTLGGRFARSVPEHADLGDEPSAAAPAARAGPPARAASGSRTG